MRHLSKFTMYLPALLLCGILICGILLFHNSTNKQSEHSQTTTATFISEETITGAGTFYTFRVGESNVKIQSTSCLNLGDIKLGDTFKCVLCYNADSLVGMVRVDR